MVMACNMSSAVALDAARKCWPQIPVIGVIEPGARAAVEVSEGSDIGVLATTGTVRSGAYTKAVSDIDPWIRVHEQACPKFVPLVESGNAGSEEAEAAARTYVAPLTAAGCRTIILGCTHYPFLRRAIEAAAGPDVRIVDPAEETARTLQSILSAQNCQRRLRVRGSHVLCHRLAARFRQLRQRIPRQADRLRQARRMGNSIDN